MSKEHAYSNDEITVVWKKDLCIHSKLCWKGLGQVFKPGERPWIDPNGASTAEIVSQVSKCPSGALSIQNAGAEIPSPVGVPEVQISPNGPLILKTSCSVTHSDGRKEARKQSTAFCRCGGSANKPYCDGSHKSAGFEG